MASGLPVVATKVGGIEDYLRDGENGLIVERDAADLAVKLDRLLNDPELQARLREQGLTTAAGYAWEKIAKQYLALFDEVIADRTRGSGLNVRRLRWLRKPPGLVARNPGFSI